MLGTLYAVFFADGFGVDHFVFAALAGLVLEDMIGYQLAVVLVGRDHVNVETFAGGTLSHGADYIVGLEPREHEHRNAERLNYLRERLKSVDDELRGGRTSALVFGIELISERASRRIETHRQMAGLFALDEFQKVLREPEQYARVRPFGIYHRPAQEGIVHLEYQGVTVYEKKFHNRMQI